MRIRPRVMCLMLAASLGGCADHAYFLKSDADIGIPTELGFLASSSLLADHPLEVATTFKSDGMVQPQASATLYHSVAAGLHKRGIDHLRHYAAPAGDVAPEISTLPPPDDTATESLPAKAPPAPLRAPRLLVLVEDHPDLSGGTRARYFFSGMALGSWSPNRATDRYDITIAYSDPWGRAHVYHSHEEMILAAGSKLFNRDQRALAGLRRYNDPQAAFGGAVINALNGPGLVTVGKAGGAATDPAGSGAAP